MIWIVGLLVAVSAALAASALLPRRLSWLAWAIPLTLTVWTFLEWLEERRPPVQGDNQPGVVLLVGALVVVVTGLAAAIGRTLRR